MRGGGGVNRGGEGGDWGERERKGREGKGGSGRDVRWYLEKTSPRKALSFAINGGWNFSCALA